MEACKKGKSQTYGHEVSIVRDDTLSSPGLRTHLAEIETSSSGSRLAGDGSSSLAVGLSDVLGLVGGSDGEGGGSGVTLGDGDTLSSSSGGNVDGAGVGEAGVLEGGDVLLYLCGWSANVRL